MPHTKPSPVNRPLLTPELWSSEILEAFKEQVALFPPRMISNQKLKALAEEAADVPQLADLHDALKELMWRRLQQGKLDKKLDRLKRHVEEVRPQKTGKSGRIRSLMARLKF